MSLNKKYTWADFLKEHPEYKEKKIKRTSKEGQKAFEAAYKQHIKEYLKGRLAKIDKEQERIEKGQRTLAAGLKATKKIDTKKDIVKKTGIGNSYLARLQRMRSRTKTLQKGI